MLRVSLSRDSFSFSLVASSRISVGNYFLGLMWCNISFYCTIWSVRTCAGNGRRREKLICSNFSELWAFSSSSLSYKFKKLLFFSGLNCSPRIPISISSIFSVSEFDQILDFGPSFVPSSMAVEGFEIAPNRRFNADIFLECIVELRAVCLIPFPSLFLVVARILNLRKSGFSVASEEALSPRPISTVLQMARSVKL